MSAPFPFAGRNDQDQDHCETSMPKDAMPERGMDMKASRPTAVQMLEHAIQSKYKELEELNRLHKLAKIAELNPDLEETLYKLLDSGRRMFR
jgi:hypothetical protein